MSVASVVNQMQAHSLPDLPVGAPVLDGRIHRFGPKKKAWYALREVTLKSGKTKITGAFGVWQGTDNGAVPVKIDWRGVSAEERQAAEEKQREFDAKEKEKRERQAAFAAKRAREQWDSAGKLPPGASTPYLDRKKITPVNARIAPDGTLLVPALHYLPDGSRLAGLQKILPDGNKRFNAGMEKKGAAMRIGEITADTLLIMMGEGYATAVSVVMAVGDKHPPTVVAFDAGNLLSVAQSLRRIAPSAHILFLADDDFPLEARLYTWLQDEFSIGRDSVAIDGVEYAHPGGPRVKACWKADAFGDQFVQAEVRTDRGVRQFTFRNTGILSAKTAARDIGNASVVWPAFPFRGINRWTDFNDLHVHESLDEVRRQVQRAIEMAVPSCYAYDNIVQFPPSPSKKQGAPPASGNGKPPDKKKEKVFSDAFWATVNALLERFTLIYGDDAAWDEEKRKLISVRNMRLAFGATHFKYWQENPRRKTIDKECLVFDPTLSCDPKTTINVFDGLQVVPKKGECGHILQLMMHLCDDQVHVFDWVIRWIAYPLQNPGAKMRSSVITHGDEGSGKNLFWEKCVGGIYGKYCQTIGNAEIEGQFNEWASGKLFIVADEVVTRSELRHMKGKLRNLVTGEKVNINPKFISARVESNHMNFVFLSNELIPLVLDRSDRRYMVLWTPPRLEKDFYSLVGDEIRNGGIEAFYHHLLHAVEMGGFNEYSEPLETESKGQLKYIGAPPSERFYYEWSKGYLPIPFISCTYEQLYSAFQRWCTVNGERYVENNTMFGRNVVRISAADGVRRKTVRCSIGGVRKQKYAYLIGHPPNNKSETEWFDGASSLFETNLRNYRSAYTGPSPPDEC
ncbi:MAG: DUF5906 domain-containing protein [Burkholderiaceae bacterium]|jgi:putative DNA primase/helicase|nr:DUF5906 domain-containing protein [Burkholderiaceae bacterium]